MAHNEYKLFAIGLSWTLMKESEDERMVSFLSNGMNAVKLT